MARRSQLRKTRRPIVRLQHEHFHGARHQPRWRLVSRPPTGSGILWVSVDNKPSRAARAGHIAAGAMRLRASMRANAAGHLLIFRLGRAQGPGDSEVAQIYYCSLLQCCAPRLATTKLGARLFAHSRSDSKQTRSKVTTGELCGASKQLGARCQATSLLASGALVWAERLQLEQDQETSERASERVATGWRPVSQDSTQQTDIQARTGWPGGLRAHALGTKWAEHLASLDAWRAKRRRRRRRYERNHSSDSSVLSLSCSSAGWFAPSS